jgi:hypothetical protein
MEDTFRYIWGYIRLTEQFVEGGKSEPIREQVENH